MTEAEIFMGFSNFIEVATVFLSGVVIGVVFTISFSKNYKEGYYDDCLEVYEDVRERDSSQ